MGTDMNKLVVDCCFQDNLLPSENAALILIQSPYYPVVNCRLLS